MYRYQKFLNEELSPDVPEAVRIVLTKIGILYGLWSLDAHSSELYASGYFVNADANRKIRSTILKLCEELKPEAVALVDAFAPPDFIINSVLGNADGNIYKHIYEALTSHPEAFERPKWWREFTDNKPKIASLVPSNVHLAKF